MPNEQGSAWPWTDAIDASIPNELYGQLLCGYVQYSVTDLDGWPTDLVMFDAFTARIYFWPKLHH